MCYVCIVLTDKMHQGINVFFTVRKHDDVIMTIVIVQALGVECFSKARVVMYMHWTGQI